MGYCAWRDENNPTDILDVICKKYNLPKPEYTEQSVRIGFKEFFTTSQNRGKNR